MDYDYWTEVIEENIPGQMERSEVTFLMQCAELSSRKYQRVNLGAYLGKSTAAICAVGGTRREVITIDNFKYVGRLGPSTPEMVRENLARLGLSANILTADSCRVPNTIKRVGLLSIDTDHNSRHLNKELDAWLPYMVDRGIVVLHDYYAEHYAGYVATIDARLKGHWELLGIQHITIGFRKPC